MFLEGNYFYLVIDQGQDYQDLLGNDASVRWGGQLVCHGLVADLPGGWVA
jgi:hypothetical protein